MLFAALVQRLHDLGHPDVEIVRESDDTPATTKVPFGIFASGDPGSVVAALVARIAEEAAKEMKGCADGDASMNRALVGMETIAKARGRSQDRDWGAQLADPGALVGERCSEVELWAGRIARLVTAAVPVLAWMRDHGFATLDSSDLIDLLDLSTMDAIGRGDALPDLPNDLRKPISEYCRALPEHPEVPNVRLDQHGYAQMRIRQMLPGIVSDGFAVLRRDGAEGRTAYAVVHMLSPQRQWHRAGAQPGSRLSSLPTPALSDSAPGLVWCVVAADGPEAAHATDSIPVAQVAARAEGAAP